MCLVKFSTGDFGEEEEFHVNSSSLIVETKTSINTLITTGPLSDASMNGPSSTSIGPLTNGEQCENHATHPAGSSSAAVPNAKGNDGREQQHQQHHGNGDSSSRKRNNSKNNNKMTNRRSKHSSHQQHRRSHNSNDGKSSSGRGGNNRRRQYDDDSHFYHSDLSSQIPFSREIFVKANYLFTLNPRTKATALRGKDGWEWENVESVFVNSEEQICCPICLEESCAPVMSTCGHIFCKSCIYRYFIHGGGDTYERCPLCAALICEKQTKRVASIKYFERLKVGDQSVRFVLLKRRASSTLPVPVEHELPKTDSIPRVGTPLAQYARMSLETCDHVVQVCAQHNRQLQMQHGEMHAFGDSFGADQVKRAMMDIHSTYKMWTDGKYEKHHHHHHDQVNPDEELSYFYQIEDGRDIFLDPFNLKCLAHQYGDRSNFPPILEKCKVKDIKRLVLTPEVVKRCSYLVHIPIHANITFVEVNLKPYLNEETLAAFAEEFKQRDKRRLAKKRADKRHDKIAQAKQHEIYGVVDYKKYQERQKAIDAEIAKQLEHAFDTSLTGDVVSEQEAMEIALRREQEKNGQRQSLWTAQPHTIGSFSAVVNNPGHFPELGSSSSSKKNEQQNTTATTTRASPWGVAVPSPPPPPSSTTSSSPPDSDLASQFLRANLPRTRRRKTCSCSSK